MLMPLRPPSGEYALYEMPFALQNRAVLSSPPLIVSAAVRTNAVATLI